ncbi:hypothetical protein COW36_23150 [bacterium (Candidatus Blackallbacteria) CG17_big_fil_post_rev_8_21_14_2_50_48_46]|uniref:O-GlcNAc transferase C-terminal domain-containing protein n=1 Tax=bacterium (Candidatus Blackallbacteria) CG17_big_fil_post_rev_8_21_14_2_50_48_46 TaxID=2014261 RepID=A0A2M7FXN4_9BACT|nr:MAG: hypothetical protein COW64_17365 [bacterium (Candidatus Blackallbacteria) CG18_big_fil_WC_8_21_14_2_50_49_26]PIW13942.1 MAG: hypothetical protein COW36_23150 [bacterium (Candidatus Blackallbacteria) CG17_big_fil_post_rev_8_21_14_2_50_48_46]PIW46793.1 MAG: hypothetical protein COW20_14330 [bacterium (Candidatus Blackallbacteria) CG13_big_fil_rev_8_21_14_2_50_49_14]
MSLERAWQALQAGKSAEAFELYQTEIPHQPTRPELWWGLALLAWQSGEGRRAETFFKKALEWDPSASFLADAQAYGHFPPAFQQLLLSFILAIIAAWQAGPEREQARQLALLLNAYPATHAEQACILASLFHALAEPLLSECWCVLSLELAPSAQTWFVRAQLRFSQGERSGAEAACREALALDSGHWQARMLLGHLLLESYQLQEALAHYQQVLAQKPDFAPLYFHLGRMQQSLGNLEQAQLCYQRALALQPGQALWRLQAKICYAPLPVSELQLEQSLAQLRQALEDFQIPIRLSDWQNSLGQTNLDTLFDLHYFSEQPLALKQAFARHFQAPEAPLFHRRSRRLRLGVLVTPQHEGVFLFVSGRLLAALDPEQVEVILLIWPASEVIFAQELPQLQRFHLSPDWAFSVKAVQALNLDAVYFWEAGTDPLNYFMPFFRLGRVQFTSWGSGGSTGIPEMDYFLSSPALEGPQAAQCYSEKLVLSQALPIWYGPEQLLSSGKSRSALGLPETGVLALFPHNLLKLHPRFERVLAELAQFSPALRFVFVNSRNPVWNQQVQARLLKQISAEQLLFLPRLEPPDFLALLEQGDFALDPWPYGAGKLAFEAIALGLPLLTCPGQTLKSRIPMAIYQVLGISDCVAFSELEYLEKAKAMVQDPAYCLAFRETLLQRRAALFYQPQAPADFLKALQFMCSA